MSVLIKTMEMPKNCGECQFCHTENFTQWCCPTGREDILCDAIPEWCPLEKPKTGEWKPKNHHTDYCSNCGFEETQWRTTDYNFCPSCGARMKGVDDEYTV